MSEIKIGDVVNLNSSPGISLTVICIENGMVYCMFYDSSNHVFKETSAIPVAAVSKKRL